MPNILLVSATADEHGEDELFGYPIHIVGVGKVNAAIVASLLIAHFDCRALLFSGVAGGLDPKLNIGDVVVATRVVQHDYGKIQTGQQLEIHVDGTVIISAS